MLRTPDLLLYLDVVVPEGGLAVLGVSVVVEHSVRFLLSVVPPGRVAVMDGSVDGPGGQSWNSHGDSDDGGRGQDLPPHSGLKMYRVTV